MIESHIMFERVRVFKTRLFTDITSVPEILQTSHFSGLDGLRGISILLVIIGHLFWSQKSDLANLGLIGVDTFFVISGFLITTLLLKEKINSGSISLKNFYIRRVLRIMPVAYLYLLILVVLNAIFTLNITFKSFATAALYLKNIPFKNAGEWYTGHFWSLAVEEQFYLIFPVLMIRYFKNYTLVVLGVIFAIVFFEVIGYHNVFNSQSNQIIHIITFIIINAFGKGTVEILIGSLASLLLFKNLINITYFRLNYWFSFLLIIAAYFIDAKFFNPIVTPLIFAMLLSIIILNTLYQKTFLKYIIENKLLTRIGVLSYSIYIWQQLFVQFRPWGQSFKYSDSIPLNMAALIVVACSSYYLYERPFLKLKNRFKIRYNATKAE